MRKKNFFMDKPIEIWFSILEFAKITLSDQWYRLKRRYKDKISLLYMDTDKLMIQKFYKNIYSYLNDDIKYYDISNFDKNTNKPIKPGINCKIPGLLKDELANTEIKEDIFNGPKSYILNCSNGDKN